MQNSSTPIPMHSMDSPAVSRANSRPASRVASVVFRTDGRFIEIISEKGFEKPRRPFKSSRLTGEYDKPWLAQKADRRERLDKVFFYCLTAIGAIIGGYICYQKWSSVGGQNYCLQWEDDFSRGIDSAHWNYEVQLDGFGTGSFDWTTTDARNAYTDAAGLHIVPTLTTDDTKITPAQLVDGYTLNLAKTDGGDGTCTGAFNTSCIATSNATSGASIPPVRSARLNTKGKHSIKYGKIEVVAKLPSGDWLWPAIWMMPETSAYGEWPASGEIDIMESRGNSPYVFKNGGRNTVSGALHWGPSADLDQYQTTMGSQWLRRGADFTQGYHTFGLEWTADSLVTYYDNALRQSLSVPFGPRARNQDMYTRGQFQHMNDDHHIPDASWSAPNNPWASSPNPNAPFDQAFYLILNVAVGGTNGFFPDAYAEKPWLNGQGRGAASSSFWNASAAWKPTWGDANSRGMTVKSVKMYSAC